MLGALFVDFDSLINPLIVDATDYEVATKVYRPRTLHARRALIRLLKGRHLKLTENLAGLVFGRAQPGNDYSPPSYFGQQLT
jgi:hypothetical protein